MGDSRRAGIFKACMWLGLGLPILMLAVGFFAALIGPNLIGDMAPDTELRWWLIRPRSWHAHPFTHVWGLVAGCVGAVVAAVAFWIKGKYWP